ncbi:DEAD/DEAH box helicase [Sulfurospirillum sp. T05]|uniref:DEAD/DEAH box helicase n=1 Tax=Sulfurospirillum tamanense TaxID=2813362 RepID=A0ABS2WQW3_9BACT|nr:DEAD/DEAH box helicase [Sulfurospirillum tamanensis]MBN2964003.1 DEAD/DEAH box helicase [Sulfurospirillum tamanensis]
MPFQSLGIDPRLCTTLATLGYNVPTPVQEKVIPLILQGRDLMATAQTGTGKTAAYVLPLLHNLINSPASPALRGLILVPTRELATQVERSVRTYAQHTGLTSCAVYGGAKLSTQTKKLESGVQILIATPGRLLEHLKLGNVSLESLRLVVFDEADRILDMGFWADVQTLVALFPKKRQTLLFSVNLNKSIKRFSEICLKKPLTIALTPTVPDTSHIAQIFYGCDKEQKNELLSYLIGSRNFSQALVFTRTKGSADVLGAHLKESGLKTAIFHGDIPYAHRAKALNAFKAGVIQVLVATDIASRGLDIEKLPVIINFDLPPDAEDYIHRIGRTGRAGESGEAFTLVTPEDKSKLKEIEALAKRTFKIDFLEGFEAKRWHIPKPKKQGKRPTQKGKKPDTKLGKKTNAKTATKPTQKHPTKKAKR